MIDPETTLKEGDRISLPYELVNQLIALLMELPAKNSMSLILAVQQDAEVVE